MELRRETSDVVSCEGEICNAGFVFELLVCWVVCSAVSPALLLAYEACWVCVGWWLHGCAVVWFRHSVSKLHGKHQEKPLTAATLRWPQGCDRKHSSESLKYRSIVVVLSFYFLALQ